MAPDPADNPADLTLLGLVLAPLDGASPAGEDLRLDLAPRALYSSLRDARAEARAAERLADDDPAAAPAGTEGWSVVERLAVEALSKRSKDVEVACWLTESLTRRRGLAGLADGAAILAGLVARFWDHGLHPALDDDEGPEGRLATIAGLSGQERDGSLAQPLRKIVLFERADGTAVTLWQYERSRELAGLGGQARKSQRAVPIPFGEIESAARGNGRAALLALGREARRAAAAWQALEEAVAAVVPLHAVPATGRVRTLLETLERIAGRYVPAEELQAAPDAAGADGAAPHAGTPPRGARTLLPAGREALLAEVLRIAAAFRDGEPHSPLSYTLEEAVRRARLPWPDLLREMLPDLSPRAALLSGLGIRPPAE